VGYCAITIERRRDGDAAGPVFRPYGRDPRIRAIIRERRIRRLDKLASLSLWELEKLIRDRKISAAVRFNDENRCGAEGGNGLGAHAYRHWRGSDDKPPRLGPPPIFGNE